MHNAKPHNEAFSRAAEHSRRVKRLRWILPLISAFIAAVFIGASYLRSMLIKIEVGPAALEGTTLVIERPKIVGSDKNKHPYEVVAKSARQDVRNPKQVELEEIEAKLELAGNNKATMTSGRGFYNNETETIRLERDVHVTSTLGYTMDLQEAFIDMKAGTLVSEKPVEVRQGQNNKITADSLHVTNSGEVIRFEGNVRAQLTEESGTTAP